MHNVEGAHIQARRAQFIAKQERARPGLRNNRLFFSPHGEIKLLCIHELRFKPNRTEVYCFGVHIHC